VSQQKTEYIIHNLLSNHPYGFQNHVLRIFVNANNTSREKIST